MRSPAATLCSIVLVLAASAAQAQGPTRVRGTVSAFDGEMLTVKSATGEVSIRLAEKTQIVHAQPIALADIKPGDFLGVTSTRHDNGTLTAFEVRRFPKAVNPGHRPFDGRNDQTMTNASVASVVQSARGRELTLAYEGGSQKIVVPENASISMLVPGERAHLMPGAPVNLTAVSDNGEPLRALRIQVGAPKVQ
ncbi:MAG: hypothetical protein IT529_22120 [Burkholderiales bacterium]|nr:hypothetical protein [Burkholderiales bacterium]